MVWCHLNPAGEGWRRGSGGGESELRGPGGDEVSEGRDLVGVGEAVTQIGGEVKAELADGSGQGHEGVPGGGARRTARAEADVTLADALAGAELGRVVVEWQLRMVEHQQQLRFLVAGQRQA